MSRLRRLLLNHRIFFLTTHFAKTALPISGEERDEIVWALHESHGRRGFLLFAYVVMPTHVHLLLAPHGDDTFSAILRTFKVSAAKRILSKRKQRGSLWQARSFDRIMRNRKEWSETLEYIHTNPIKDGLVKKPDDWQWSSWTALAHGKQSPIPVDIVDMPINEKAWLIV